METTFVAKHVSFDDHATNGTAVLNAKMHITAEQDPLLDLCITTDMAELLRQEVQPGAVLTSARVFQVQRHTNPDLDADWIDWDGVQVRVDTRTPQAIELTIIDAGDVQGPRIRINLEE